VEGEGFREAEIVDEGGHYFGVVLYGESARGDRNPNRHIPRGTNDLAVLGTSGSSMAIGISLEGWASGSVVIWRKRAFRLIVMRVMQGIGV
jgi:hypothetical protein